MKIKTCIGCVLALLLAFSITGCKSYQGIYSSEDVETVNYSEIYDNLESGEKAIIWIYGQTSSFKYTVLQLEDDTLRVEKRNGEMFDIPLMEVRYIYTRQPNKSGTLILGIGLGFAILAIAGFVTWSMAY